MTAIDRLIQQMTFEEKVSLLAGADLWHTVPVDRLDIPALRLTDGPNGARGAFSNLESTSACTPVGVALGATWNPELIEEIGRVLGEETRTKGAQILLGPTVNIQRSPLAGRNFECFSEDPYLSGEIAAAYIRGVQSQGVGACIKHFVCNDQETDRFSISVEVDRRALHEIYLEPFRRAIRGTKPWAVMSAYNRINGEYAAEHDYLLRTVLRDEWGFDGVIISDWYGTYSHNTPNGELNLEMPGPARWMGLKHFQAAITGGTISEEVVDGKVRRLLRTIERAGLLAEPGLPTEKSIDKPEHRQIIRRTAQEAIVLLKNEGVLPLETEGLTSIAVIGENALYSQVLGGGSSAVAAHYLVSPLEGITRRVGESVDVAFAAGCFVHKGLPAPDAALLSTVNGNQGLVLEFFDNLDCSGRPAKSLITQRVQFGWFDNCVPGVHQDRFSVRISGFITPAVNGMHTFGLNMVGQGRLYLDNVVLIDSWDVSTADGLQPVSIELEAGRAYAVRIEYKWQGDPRWRSLAVGYLPPHADDLIGEAVNLAARSDVAIVVAGLNSEWESESFDRPDMLLPGDQNLLIEKIAEVNPKVVVVLNCGSPVEMPWIDKVPALLQLWYDSQEQGNALADVLFGDVSPSGRLPQTFPRRLVDNPSYGNFPGENGIVHYSEGVFVGYRYYDQEQIEPLFPFGHGLAYTTFEYSNLRLEREPASFEDGVKISLEVKNTGTQPGKEVIQVYVGELSPRLMRPQKELKAFRKIALAAGEEKTIEFDLGGEAFSFYDPQQERWVADPGEFDILIGASSKDIRLSTVVNFIS